MQNPPGTPSLTRRAALGALGLRLMPLGPLGPLVPLTTALLGGCSTPLPLDRATPASDASAAARLRESAEAHGLATYRRLTDINIAYDGQWRPLIGRIQPEVVDEGFRGRSQERVLPAAGLVAQAYRGPQGRKQVVWRRPPGRADATSATSAPSANTAGDVSVWFNGQRSSDAAAQNAAALVAECYGLFLLGPLWLIDRTGAVQAAGTERVDGRLCDVLNVWMSPGLGRAATDRVAVCVDRSDGLARRLRFTLEGFANTHGAVAEVDTFDHATRFGVVWPMRSHERVVHPIALPAHDWHITGLDVNRGYPAADVSGPEFSGAAARPAAPL